MDTAKKLIVSDKWLATCGLLTSLSGVPLHIISSRDYGTRGKFYNVMLPNGNDWVVWDFRGVEILTGEW